MSKPEKSDSGIFGWLFKSSDRLSQEAKDCIGCFGKMPVHEQAIRHHVETSGLNGFEKKLHEAANLIKHKGLLIPDKIISSAPTVYFLLIERSFCPVGGVLVSSIDLMREPYPFMVFNQVVEKNLGRQQTAALMMLVEFFEKSAELCAMDWGSQTLENLLLSVDSLPGRHASAGKEKLFETEIDILNQIEISDYWDGIKNFSENELREQFLMALQAAFSKCNSKTPSKTQWGIRFPLPDTEFLLPFVIFFTELCMELFGETNSDMQFFWHPANENYQSTLTVYLGPVQTASLTQVMDYTVRDNFLLDLLDEMPKFTESNDTARDLTQRDHASLMETLFHWVNWIRGTDAQDKREQDD